MTFSSNRLKITKTLERLGILSAISETYRDIRTASTFVNLHWEGYQLYRMPEMEKDFQEWVREMRLVDSPEDHDMDDKALAIKVASEENERRQKVLKLYPSVHEWGPSEEGLGSEIYQVVTTGRGAAYKLLTRGVLHQVANYTPPMVIEGDSIGGGGLSLEEIEKLLPKIMRTQRRSMVNDAKELFVELPKEMKKTLAPQMYPAWIMVKEE